MVLMHSDNLSTSSKKAGRIEVIAGPMFSGKTEELLRRLKRALIANQQIEVFKHELDNRYDDEKVFSHDNNFMKSTSVSQANEILELSDGKDVIGIDEAQFFTMELVNVCNTMADHGQRVIVSGLDMNFKGEPFGPVPALMACAEEVIKVQAICMQCGELAYYSHRILPDKQQVVIGTKDVYDPLCRDCFTKAV